MGLAISSFFPVNTGVRQGPSPVWPGYWAELYTSHCRAPVGNTKITDLVFADDAVIFVESLEILVMALVALHEEAQSLELQVSWPKTKVQVFGDLCEIVHSGEDIDILESFTYLSRVL